ncbi:MAG: 16S rRNA (uracil(1498)-N(3))-methyltransferase [Gammaproteobacteria bacterium]|nr:16S rRNA (uracil(1498)-N(3))-methyltransferase [Gammaproteobacteria bacterium]NNJ83935.1 16S rRNA (uracil(1498)-N(3))-methyltransferase [Gammaproteobacteria bacterium]
MSETRIYLDTSLYPDSVLNLPTDAARHVTRVLRLRAGTPLVLFNGEGGELDAEIIEVRGQAVAVRTEQHRDVDREPPLTLSLVQGISRSERMDWVIQKAVELGVSRIEPVFTARSVVRLNIERTARRLQHWRGIAVSACEQCGRNRIPEIMNPLHMDEWALNRRAGSGNALLLQPGAEKKLTDIEYAGGQVTLLIGPEGGLTQAEAERAKAIGFVPVSLGPRTLRTETAAIASLAVIQHHWGDF